MTDTIYMAQMPDVFGYGITCFSKQSSTDALKKVEVAYREGMKLRGNKLTDSFIERFEYYGGRINHIEFDKVYDENCC